MLATTLEIANNKEQRLKKKKGAAKPLQAPKRLQVSCSMKNFSASQRAAASTPYATVAAEQRTLDRKSLILTSFYRRRRSRCGTAKTRRIAGDSGGAIPIIPHFLKFVKVRCIRKKKAPEKGASPIGMDIPRALGRFPNLRPMVADFDPVLGGTKVFIEHAASDKTYTIAFVEISYQLWL